MNPLWQETPHPLERGPCPSCDGRGGESVFPDCVTCKGTGWVVFAVAWSQPEDLRLQEMIKAGRPPRFAAVNLRRPLGNVNARIALLKLESPRGEAAPVVSVRPCMVRE